MSADGKLSMPLALVVDDDAAVRTRARYELMAAGFRSCEAASGDEAVAAFRRERPSLA